jgi:energy-converting hydrogenase Eha subunit A
VSPIFARPRSAAPSAWIIASCLSAAACSHAVVANAPAPSMAAEQLSEPPAEILLPSNLPDTLVSIAPTPEKLVTLIGELPVRTALEEIAKEGNFSLAISPLVSDRRIRLSILNAPASVALQTVLDAAGLTLQPTRALRAPYEPSIVFYRLPVNVNALSIEAIMKQFGVSRDIAELIVQSRPTP